MIFVTVGTQLPFDRLIMGMDEWARRHPDTEVFAQIRDAVFLPAYMEFARKLSPNDYMKKFLQASMVVSHCGVGTIITGLDNLKPMILMPRERKFGEHRNDYQKALALKFSRFDLIDIVETVDELKHAVERRLARAEIREGVQAIRASHKLIDCIRVFVDPESVDRSG